MEKVLIAMVLTCALQSAVSQASPKAGIRSLAKNVSMSLKDEGVLEARIKEDSYRLHNYANELVKLVALNPATGILALVFVVGWAIWGFHGKHDSTGRGSLACPYISKFAAGTIILQIFYSGWVDDFIFTGWDENGKELYVTLFFVLGELIVLCVFALLWGIVSSCKKCLAKPCVRPYLPLPAQQVLPLIEEAPRSHGGHELRVGFVPPPVDTSLDEKVIGNIYMNIDESFLKAVAVFLVQASLMVFYVEELFKAFRSPEKIRCEFDAEWKAPTEDHPAHIFACNDAHSDLLGDTVELSLVMWLVLLVISVFKADSRGAAFNPQFWQHILEYKAEIRNAKSSAFRDHISAEPLSTGASDAATESWRSELLRCFQHVIAFFCSSEVVQWRLRQVFSFVVNYICRRFVLYTAPVMVVQQISSLADYEDLSALQLQILSIFAITKLDDVPEPRSWKELMSAYCKSMEQKGSLESYFGFFWNMWFENSESEKKEESAAPQGEDIESKMEQLEKELNDIKAKLNAK
jgi:hypothetical protein